MKNSGVEWIGEIPEDWEAIRLKYIYSTTKAKLPKQFYDDKSLTPYLSMDFIRDSINTEPVYAKDGDYCSEEDILILWDGSNAGEIVFNHPAGYAPSTTAILKKLSTQSLPVYDKFYLKSLEDDLRRNTNGMGIPHVNGSYLNNSLFLLPPKSTQQHIASYLDKKCSKIEETIQNQQQVIEKLKAYKQSLITEAVTGKIKIQNGKVCGKYESYKDSGVEWIGKIPTEWEVGKFGRFAQVKSNLVDPNLYLEYPQIAPDNIGKGSGKLIDWQTVKDSGVISWNHLFFKGQIVYSKIRPTLNKLIIAPFDGLCSADMYPIETNIHKQFFVYMMLSQYFVEQVGLITRDRVKMPKINQNELSGILITVPTKEEQKEISDYLDKKCTAIDTAIEQKQKLIEKLTEYKKSLIYECVTGKKEI